MRPYCRYTLLLAACLAAPLSAQAAEAAEAAETVSCDSYAADLAAMASADQAIRTRIDFLDPLAPKQVKLSGYMRLVDRTNTARLKRLVARCGWPSRNGVGDQAAGNAWLLAQHADHDPAFQKEVLVLMEREAAASGGSVDQQFALLSDRIAVAEKRPQRYGTQLASRSDSACDLDFAPMDDRTLVEERRARLGLPSLEKYKELVLQLQHCPDSRTGEHHYAAPPGGRTLPSTGK